MFLQITAEIAMGYLFAWEKLETGLTWDLIAQSPVEGDKFAAVQECIIHHLVQIVFYMVLHMYSDNFQIYFIVL